ncbi:tetratricopeptide repeat protein [Actinomyces oris]|uniref:tetratricopeptide repeat protein n=2 Tax=Actinomyces oris TaxID=544580 RepID=UPI0028E6D304|nr:tetratricopeptide repeat protein [Actinomyces oris]
MTTRHPSASPTQIRFGSRPAIAAGFVKRQEQDELVDAVFTRVEPRTVLTGMRGSGKTQLAAAVAARCEEEGWPLVAWIRATSRKEILAGLYEFALRIGIDAPKNIPLEVIVQRLLDRLRSAEAADRLFVFDNVENPDDLRDLIPEGAGVRTLITTTHHLDWDGLGWLRLTVGTFEREQSISLLCEHTGDTHRETADRIVDALGDLPVAITQAAATAQQGGYSLSGYLDRLSHHPLESRMSRLEGANYPDAVGIALLMAYEQVLEQLRTKHPQQERIAVSLLGALSLLAASGVPTHWLLALDGDSDAVRDTLSVLKSASVIQESSDGDKTFIHWLQGHVYRETYLNDQKKLGEACSYAATLLSGIDVDRLDNGEQQRDETRHLIEQFLSVTSQDYSHSLYSEPQVSSKLAETLHDATSLGMSQLALCLTDSVTQACDVLGPHHPDTLASRNNLAGTYRASGRLDKAIALYEQTLEDSIRGLGTDHPSTLTSRLNLAGAYQAAGRLSEAIPLYEQVFSGRSRVLGPDHRSTLMSRDELAGAYREAGRFDEAITLKKQILADAMRIMGPDSPGASAARSNLAATYRDAGRLDEAITLYQENLDNVTRTLGLDHLETLASRHRLAGAHRDAGRLDEAIALFEQNLTDFTRVLGPDHPHTLSSRGTLAGIYRDAGRLDEAIPLFEQNLDDRTRTLGLDHPETLASRHSLAGAYRDAGRLDEAIPLFEQNLTDFIRILGPDRPDTFTSRSTLAGAYQAAGRLDEAIPLFEQNLEDRTRTLGPVHPVTLTSRGNLAGAYRAAGRIEDAEKLFGTP